MADGWMAINLEQFEYVELTQINLTRLELSRLFSSLRSNKSICKHENLYWRSHYETLYKPPFYYIVTGNRNNMCNGVL